MEIRRFYVAPQDINGEVAIVEGDEFYHMNKVLRYKQGYKACLCCGDGHDYLCEVLSIANNKAELKVLSRTKNESEPTTKLTLCQAILKNDKLDYIIQKCVELGVEEVDLFDSENVSANRNSISLERLERIAKEACKQSGRAKKVSIKGIYSFEEILKKHQSSFLIFPYEKEREQNFSTLEIPSKTIALLVGSEGGFTEKERNIALQAGAKSVSLGRRILRADTAAIIATATVMMKKGELDV